MKKKDEQLELKRTYAYIDIFSVIKYHDFNF